MSVKQAAARVHVIPDTIHYHIDKGNLKYIYTDRRYWVNLDSLKSLYAKNSSTFPQMPDQKGLASKRYKSGS